jgi:hypothetical protein
MMRGKWLILILVALLWAPGWAAGAVSEEDFILDTTDDLVAICTAPDNDPLQREAISFCMGYLVGAFHYHMAENAGPDGSAMVCPPNPKPPRAKVLKMFMDWAKKHPEYKNDEPVETWFRFLTETYPCKP